MDQKDVIDEKRVQAYLDLNGICCPYCGSQNIEGGYFDNEGKCQQVECHECGMDWYDIYELVGIGRAGADVVPDDLEITKLRKALQAILEKAEVTADNFDGEAKLAIEKLNDIAFVALFGIEKENA
jgi:hypothetical protein